MRLLQKIFGGVDTEKTFEDINKSKTILFIGEQKEHYDTLNDEIQTLRDDNKHLIGEEEYEFIEDKISLLEDTKTLTKKLILKLTERL